VRRDFNVCIFWGCVSLNTLSVEVYVGIADENLPVYIFVLVYASGFTSHCDLYRMHTDVSILQNKQSNGAPTAFYIETCKGGI
jgi:hypothetical protein